MTVVHVAHFTKHCLRQTQRAYQRGLTTIMSSNFNGETLGYQEGCDSRNFQTAGT
jgi:hypothetical protein